MFCNDGAYACNSECSDFMNFQLLGLSLLTVLSIMD